MPPLLNLLGDVIDPNTCDPAVRCCCGDGATLTYPMHWRPDAAPAAPWTWLDNRKGARADAAAR